MTAALLLSRARAAGVSLRLADGKIKATVPRGAEALVAELRAHRDALRELLAREAAAAAPPDAHTGCRCWHCGAAIHRPSHLPAWVPLTACNRESCQTAEARYRESLQ